MAGAGMNDIKSRIKSVNSTMQITKAMELVATSKLRRAKANAENMRPFRQILDEAISDIMSSADIGSSVWSGSESDTQLLVVVAGDRGLAGGYNANVFRLAERLASGKKTVYLPIGRKALEYYKHRGADILSSAFQYVSDISVGDTFRVSELICEGYLAGNFGAATVVYTNFVSMLTQSPTSTELLPLVVSEDKETVTDAIIGGDPEEILADIVPKYIGGVLHSAISESLASESGARRTAMNAANKNAEEMIGSLMLKYNRARQAIITQEITEIVSGAEAL